MKTIETTERTFRIELTYQELVVLTAYFGTSSPSSAKTLASKQGLQWPGNGWGEDGSSDIYRELCALLEIKG